MSPLQLHSLQTRKLDVDENGNPKELSATAIGFLVPLFLLFLMGPFCCVFCVRKRRQANPNRTYTAAVTQPAILTLRREDARKQLEDVTEISNVTTHQTATCVHSGDSSAINDEKEAVDNSSSSSLSILERECIICLSTLYPPCAPEPVKMPFSNFSHHSKELTTSNHHHDEETALAVGKVPSISESSLLLAEKEEILRLKVCGHEFHAECLISWFVIRKYSCPICRAVYFEKKDEEEDEGTETGHAGDRRNRGARYGRGEV